MILPPIPRFLISWTNSTPVRHFLIDNDHVVGLRVCIELCQRVVAILHTGHLITGASKDEAHGMCNCRIVVHRQDLKGCVHSIAIHL